MAPWLLGGLCVALVACEPPSEEKLRALSLTGGAEDAFARLRWRPLRQGDRVLPGEVILCGEGDEVMLAFSRPLMQEHLGIDAAYLLPELFPKRSEREVFLPVPARSLLRVAIPPGLGATGPHPEARAREVSGAPRVTSDLRELAGVFGEQEVFAGAGMMPAQTSAPAEPTARPPRRIGIVPFPRMGPKSGVVIERVLPGEAAAKAGLASGDKIIAVNGAQVGDIYELKRAVEQSSAERVVLQVQRKGAAQASDVILEMGR